MNKYKQIVEDALKALVRAVDADGDYWLVFSTKVSWKNPLPKEILEAPHLIIQITGWSREESAADEGGVFIMTAFGEEQNSCYLPYWEIIAVMDENKEVLFQRTFEGENPEKGKHSIASLMGASADKLGTVTEGESVSMKAMMRNNPGMFNGK